MNIGRIIFLMLLMGQSLFAQKQYQLAQPIARFESVFLDKKTEISFVFEQPGSSIRFTSDGVEPTETSPQYRKPLRIKKHLTIIKARSFAEGYAPSETITHQFFAKGHSIANIITSATNPTYAGRGVLTLTDNQSGGTNHTNAAWLGFDSDSVVIDLSLEKPTEISQVLLHVLNNQGAWIFLPRKVEVYQVDGNKPIWLTSQSFEIIRETGTEAKAMLINFPTTKAKELRIIVMPLASLPDWHAGKGKKAWFFVDEIKLY